MNSSGTSLVAAETFERIQADVKTAMRAKDRERTTALRMIVSVLKNKQIDLRRDLTRELPWLPGYDRRDAMTVAVLLSFFSGEDVNDAHDALALSMFTNARLHPSPGDAPAGHSVRSGHGILGAYLGGARAARAAARASGG